LTTSLGGESGGLGDRVGGHQPRDLPQRDVNRDVGHPEPLAHEHHRVRVGTGAVGE